VGFVGSVGRAGVLGLVLSSGCGGNPSQPSPFRLGEPFEVRIGARAELDGDSFLLLDAVPSDSRCPVDVQCVTAGEALVGVRFGTRTSPPPAGPRITLFINGAPIVDGVRAPVPWCTAQPLPVDCRLSTSEGKSTVKAGAYTIRLIRLTPVPRAGTSIAPGDYVGTFVVALQ
jgi:hypothetical protein